MRFVLVFGLMFATAKIYFDGNPPEHAFEGGLTKGEFLLMSISLLGGWLGYELYRYADGQGNNPSVSLKISLFRTLAFIAGISVVTNIIGIAKRFL